MTKYCRQCGAVVGAGLAFCTNCGAQVANLDEGPETVVSRPIVIPIGDPEPIIQPQQPQQPIVAQPLPPARSSGRTVLLVLSGAVVAICGAAGIAALFYFLGRQATTTNANLQNAQTNINSNVANQSPTPAVTPTPKQTPAVQTENVTGNEVCSVTAPTQLHRDCDTKDCDTDATTAAAAASTGSKVTRLGFYKKGARSFKWEKVSLDGKELWISSNKIDCGLPTTQPPGNRPPANIPPANTQKPPKGLPQKTPKPDDPWRGIPSNATAICNDGTFSTTRVRMFQCSFHGGVRIRR